MTKIILVCFALIISLSLAAQTSITGTVVDEQNNPVPYASISIKNTKTGTQADANGHFTITASTGQTLTVSAVNYTAQEVQINGTSPLTVQLKSSEQTLNEVVVTALGVKREKKSLTYATQTISSDELNKSGTGNPLTELDGKASGLTVINSAGDPGSGTYIRLRGVTSITGDNQPLIVVDGIPIDNTINNYDPTSATPNVSGASANLTGGTQPTNRGIDLNPNDIESVTVLKGPAATALYGLKAASGALIITTKKGNLGSQKMRVEFNSSTGWSQVNKLPELQDKYAQGSGGVYAGPTGNANRRLTWGPLIDTLAWDGNTNIWDPHGNIVGKSDPLAKMPVTPYDRYAFFNTGFLTDNNVSLSGGSANTGFRASVGNVHQTGVVPKTQYNKTTFSLNGIAKLTDKLNVSGSITYINSANNKVQQGSNISGVMLGLVRTPPTFDNSYGLGDDAADNESAYVQPNGQQRDYRGGIGYDNPYWTVNRNPFNENVNRALGNLQATYQFTDWISASWRFGGDVYSQDSKNFYDINSNAFTAGLGIINEYFNSQYNSDFTVNLKKSFSDDFSGTLLLGHNYFYNTFNNRLVTGNGLIVPTFFDISNALSYASTEADGQKRTMAFYGEANLSYKNMLFLDLTGRRETSSTLPINNRDFFYPSAGLTWVFTELPAFKTGGILSYGKLRASYAQVGKDAPVQGLQTYYSPTGIADGFTTPGDFFPIVNAGGVPVGSYTITSTISVIGNPDLKPEKTNSYEAGLDLGFFKNRINLTGTYYSSKTNDAILTIPLAYTTGFAAKLFNAGVITNKGVELTLNTTPVKTKNFSWDLDINWSTNKNMVESLAPGVDKLLIAGFQGGEVDAFAGKPFGQIFGGIYQRANAGNPKDPNALPGGPLLISDDPNHPGYGQPIVSSQNAIIGDINPKWIGALINTVSYKGVTLSFQIDVRKGGDLWNGTKGAMDYFGTGKATENRGQPVTFQGLTGHLNAEGNVVHYDGSGNEVDGPGSANTAQTTYDQNYWQSLGSSFVGPSEPDVEDGSFIKLREASIGYSFPQSMLGKTFSNLSITFIANNVILHTKYKGVDPETSLAGPANGQGLDYFNNPGAKNFGIRLNIGLQ